MRHLFVFMTVLVGCSEAYASPPPERSASMPAPNPKLTVVEIASVTLGDDCGAAPAAERAAGKRSADALAERACQQTSMQLSVRLGDGAPPSTLKIEKVELFTESGKSLGILTPHAPQIWDDSGLYKAWDQKLDSTRRSITYGLSAPDWSKVADRHGAPFVLKVTVSVGGAQRALQRTINLSAPTMLPPNVVT